MSADILIRRAMDAGVSLRLVDGKLIAAGQRTPVVADLLSQLRHHKAEIFEHLSAANDPEPHPNPSNWRELAEAYHLHHFACKTCCAAGQGRGMRCGTGSALWTTYQNQI